jgi:hypothetical protein
MRSMSLSKTCVCGEESRVVYEVSPGEKVIENLLIILDDTVWARSMILGCLSTICTTIVVVDIDVFSKACLPCIVVVGIKRARCHPRFDASVYIPNIIIYKIFCLLNYYTNIFDNLGKHFHKIVDRRQRVYMDMLSSKISFTSL